MIKVGIAAYVIGLLAAWFTTPRFYGVVLAMTGFNFAVSGFVLVLSELRTKNAFTGLYNKMKRTFEEGGYIRHIDEDDDDDDIPPAAQAAFDRAEELLKMMGGGNK